MAGFKNVYSEQQVENVAKEFLRLKDLCFLDHGGCTLYSESQIEAVSKDLLENVYGNPHSLSTCSRYSTDVVDQVRYRILAHFNTCPDDYGIIFTSGATQSLKIVAETFDWTGEHHSKIYDKTSRPRAEKYNAKAGSFSYLHDNHTSVLGMRELAAEKGASVKCLSNDEVFRLMDGDHKEPESDLWNGNSLFVYPAQCNFSGVKYPLGWVEKVQSGMLERSRWRSSRSRWYCMLDAASYASTSLLDLSKIRPDFVCVSFYKMFGYPTGLGALLVRNVSANALNKVYFGGGTVEISLSSDRIHKSRPLIHDRFEDGTISFLSVVSLRHGFDALRRLAGSMPLVAAHTFNLARHLHHNLMVLHHKNGAPVCLMYADTDYEDVRTQGGVVNFNVLRSDGTHVGYMEVLNMANLYNIQLRTGCFCNPGACQRHLGLSTENLLQHYQAGHVCGDDNDLVDGRPTGSIRISFGYMSTLKDSDKFLRMVQSCFVEGQALRRTPDWWASFSETYKDKFRIGGEQEPLPDVRQEQGLGGAEVIVDTEETRRGGGEEEVLESIYVYPVKSCGAFSVDSWTVGPRGLAYDREWMIVTPAGVSLTQKQDTRMCLISPTLNIDGGLLLLDFPGMDTVRLPLQRADTGNEPDREAALCQSKVCGDRIQGWDCGDEVADWLADALLRDDIRLIRQRSCDSRSAKSNRVSGPRPVLSLSNQAQFLLLNVSSVNWLRDKMGEDPDCDEDGLRLRFRSNLVVRGFQPFSEALWKSVQIGDVRFKSEGHCTRCQMVCIDQKTGGKTREPLKTLAAAFQGKMRFGTYLSRSSSEQGARLTVGDKVTPVC